MHYLKSMLAAGTIDGSAVAAQMHALPVDDFFAKGRVREDGRLLHDFFLAEVKAPIRRRMRSIGLMCGCILRLIFSGQRLQIPWSRQVLFAASGGFCSTSR